VASAGRSELAAISDRVSATDIRVDRLAGAVGELAGKVNEIFSFMEEAVAAVGLDRPGAKDQRGRDRHGMHLVKGGQA
jgi:hypothetical protein